MRARAKKELRSSVDASHFSKAAAMVLAKCMCTSSKITETAFNKINVHHNEI